jgi:hypothetical protein
MTTQTLSPLFALLPFITEPTGGQGGMFRGVNKSLIQRGKRAFTANSLQA